MRNGRSCREGAGVEYEHERRRDKGRGLQRMNDLQPRARPEADLAMGRDMMSGHWNGRIQGC